MNNNYYIFNIKQVGFTLGLSLGEIDSKSTLLYFGCESPESPKKWDFLGLKNRF